MRVALLDGDAVAYPAAFSNNPAASAINRIQEIEFNVQAQRTIVAFSCHRADGFRRRLWPAYKQERDEKDAADGPLEGLSEAMEAIENNYQCKRLPACEADDVLGILATGPWIKGEKVVVGRDKDLLMIPGKHLSDGRWVDVSYQQATRNFFISTLKGKGKNQPGVKGIGKAKAAAIIDAAVPSVWWQMVLKTFLDKGYDEEYALTMARLSKILHFDDYNIEEKKVRLWTPDRIDQSLFSF